jgi:hypothetical protein
MCSRKSPGIAVFADSGQAVDGPFRGMKSDAGAGLRIGIAGSMWR